MSTIHLHETTIATPEQFVAALTDFGPGRALLFGNSSDADLVVHHQGPDTADVSRWTIAPTSSSMEIQLCHCRPDPIFPPRPNLNSGSCLRSAPPSPDSTIPVRRWATRTPASAAGAVAASQATHTSARKPVPGADVSSSTSSPREP